MQRIHFVYKAPRHGSLIGRIFDKIGFTFSFIPPIWRNGNYIPWKTPKRHPASASFNIIKAFKEKGNDLKFYDLWEKAPAKMKSGDKFIGLPIQVYDGRLWNDPSIDCVTRQTLEKFRSNDCTIILPYCHDARYNASTNGLIEKYGKNLVILSGKIWTDTWDQSPIKPYVKNLLRVNMGIDAGEYPALKKKFNPKGKRKFLYIGQTAWYKNTEELENIAASMPGFEGGYISTGEIKGWKKIASWADLTSEFMVTLAEEYDIFVNVSSADPSPATILEQMCFGFAIAATPESSYEYDSITKLRTQDTAFNIARLEELQNMDEEILLERARQNRRIAERDHDWEAITKKIVDFVNMDKSGEGLFLVD
ncbi:MAG: hypothetical protein V4438_03490 [Patescibacteria group bacterium]